MCVHPVSENNLGSAAVNFFFEDNVSVTCCNRKRKGNVRKKKKNVKTMEFEELIDCSLINCISQGMCKVITI